MSCPYKNIFGEPKKGFHSTRFLGFAVGDTVGTVLLAWLISYIWNFKFFPTLLWTFIIGEILHYIFGVQTSFLSVLGIKVSCE